LGGGVILAQTERVAAHRAAGYQNFKSTVPAVTTTIILRTALEPRPLVPSSRTLRNLKHDLKGVKGKYTLGCVDRDASHIPKENSPQLDWLC
jgi:hypothetical protein